MSWQRVDLSADTYAVPTEPPIVCGLIYERKRHALSGPPEAAKTLASLIFGLEYMRNGHGAFAFIDFEMGEHATRLLLDDLGATPEEIASILYFSPDGPPSADDVEAIAAAGVRLAIVDAAAGAYDATGLDDNKRADAEKFARLWITPLWKRGVTTIVLDHVVKNTENRGRYSIGSERKLGQVDVQLGLEAITQLRRGGNGLIRFSTHKDRPGHLHRPHAAELELTSDAETHRIGWAFREAGNDVPASDTWKPTALMERVLAYVAQPWYEPATRSALANGVKGKRQYVLQAIDCLIADGALALNDKHVVPVPRNVPGTYPHENGNGTFPVPSLQGERLGERFLGTPLEAAL